jgi:hypothetical protein
MRTRELPDLKDKEDRKHQFIRLYNNLPIIHGETIQLHVCRSPHYGLPDGINHNDDHQGSRHGAYAFLMNKLNLGNQKIDKATRQHFLKEWGFARGYKITRLGYEYNARSTAGDQLIGLSLAMLHNPDTATKELFEQSIVSIIENDYALLEGGVPKDSDIQAHYFKLITKNNMRPEKVKIKSSRGMFQPGLETVGAQALTILCALRVADVICNSTIAREHYNKLLWRYGYGLLSLFPTTFAPRGSRGYFNDHNCMVAAYILGSLSNKLGRRYWGTIMLYLWSLSYRYYSGYFTGMVNEIIPGIISSSYIEKCKRYIYEEEPNTFALEEHKHIRTNLEYPVKFNLMNQDEFHPDLDQKITIGVPAYRAGLGWLAHATMIDPEEAKDFLGRTNI